MAFRFALPWILLFAVACEEGSTSQNQDTTAIPDTTVPDLESDSNLEDDTVPEGDTAGSEDTALADTTPLEDTEPPPTDTTALPDEISPPTDWQTPSCQRVVGTDAVVFTRDEGETLAQSVGQLSGTVYTFGLVALGAPNTLLAAHGAQALRSTDAGCTWEVIGDLGTTLVILEAAGEDRAYGWVDNSSELIRIDGTTITTLPSPASNIVGLGVDSKNPDRLRIGVSSGGIMESVDAGETWQKIGFPASDQYTVYRFAFSPRDLDLVAAGFMRLGVRVSFDGGNLWLESKGLYVDPVRGANIFRLTFSAANPNVLWAEGIDIEESLQNQKARHIYHSGDAGRGFEKVVDQTNEILLRNGNLMVSHPTDDNVLYFVFGTYFQSFGTILYRYDRSSGEVTSHRNGHDDVGAIAFSPASPDVMYLGLISENIH